MIEPTKEFNPEKFKQQIGQKLSISKWFTIDQEMISNFGALTLDPAPFHDDPSWAREHSPYKTTIAYGFLTVSLLSAMLRDTQLIDRNEYANALNYGFEKLRMITPVPVDSRIRGHFTSHEFIEQNPGEYRFTIRVEVEVDGQDKPALVADWVFLLLVDQTAVKRVENNIIPV